MAKILKKGRGRCRGKLEMQQNRFNAAVCCLSASAVGTDSACIGQAIRSMPFFGRKLAPVVFRAGIKEQHHVLGCRRQFRLCRHLPCIPGGHCRLQPSARQLSPLSLFLSWRRAPLCPLASIGSCKHCYRQCCPAAEGSVGQPDASGQAGKVRQTIQNTPFRRRFEVTVAVGNDLSLQTSKR